MELELHVDALGERLLAAAEAGGPESRAVLERLVPSVDAAIRLVLLGALTAAADEVSAEMAPGAVEVRLRGNEPTFVVTLPDSVDPEPVSSSLAGYQVGADDEGAGTSRLNLRLPDGLKARIEDAARREGLSLNAWLVRAAATAAADPGHAGGASRSPGANQRFSGWVQ